MYKVKQFDLFFFLIVHFVSITAVFCRCIYSWEYICFLHPPLLWGQGVRCAFCPFFVPGYCHGVVFTVFSSFSSSSSSRMEKKSRPVRFSISSIETA